MAQMYADMKAVLWAVASTPVHVARIFLLPFYLPQA